MYQKGYYESFISKDSFTPFTLSWYTFRKIDDHVSFYKLEENKMSILEVTDCIRIDSELHVQPFFKGSPTPLPQCFRQEIVVCLAKVYLENFPAYLQSRKELHSSVFEEIHEHRFFLKKFIQPILYGAHYYLDIHQYSLTKC